MLYMTGEKRIHTTAISLILIISILWSFILPFAAFAAAEYNANVLINGMEVDFKNSSFEVAGTVFVPLEEMCSYIKLDCKKESNGFFTVKRFDSEVKLESGNMICKVNNKGAILSAQPRVRNGIVFVPIDFFSNVLNMQVETNIKERKVEIVPNVYKLYVNSENAAAIDATKPNSDVLKSGNADYDSLFYFENAKNLEQSVFYNFDISYFIGKKILSADIAVSLGINSNLYPRLGIYRTENWEKGKINYNNQPGQLKDLKEGATLGENYKQGAKNFVLSTYSITEWLNECAENNQPLSLKLTGLPYKNNNAANSTQVYIKGVNTPEKAYLKVVLDEQFEFPVKKEKRINAAEKNTFDELKFLCKIGVFESGSMAYQDLSEGISRCEFVSSAVKLMKEYKSLTAGNNIFSDIDKDCKYLNEIYAAAAIKIISSDNGSKFRPYDVITLGEALSVITKLLGYQLYADSHGGWVNGYYAAAQKAEVLRGVNLGSEELSYSSAINLLFNALGAPRMVEKSYSSAGAEYEFDDEQSLLSVYWDAYKIEGIVTGNHYTCFNADNHETNSIVINGKHLFAKPGLYDEALGYYAIAYCKKDDDSIFYLGTDDVKSKSEKIDFADIDSVDVNSENVVIKYSVESGKSRSKTFAKTDNLVYNGKRISSDVLTKEMFDSESGNVNFVGDKFVIITKYITMVVNSVDKGNEIIADEYEPYDKALRLKNADCYVFRNREGNAVEIDDIKKGFVLSVAESLDKKLITGELSERQLHGRVGAIINDSDKYITLDGNEFRLINRYPEWENLIKLGKTGIFLIDAFGNVAGCTLEESKQDFGYLIALSKESDIKNTIDVALITRNSDKYIKYTLANRVKIDGEQYKDADKIKSYFCDAETDKVKKQAIVFGLDADKKINRIDTAVLGEKESEDDSLSLRYRSDLGQLRYKASGRLGDLFFFDIENALTVYSPINENILNDWERILSGISNDTKLDVDIYTIGTKKPNADVVILKNFEMTSAPGSNDVLSVVDKMYSAIDDEGDFVQILSLYNASSEPVKITVPDESESLLDGVNKGDLVRIAKNYKGQLTALVKYYDYPSKKILNNPHFDQNDFNLENRIYGGYVVEKYNNYVKFAQNPSSAAETDVRWYDLTNIKNVFGYTVTNGKVNIKNVDINEIRDYEHIPYNPSGIMLQVVYASTVPKACYILEMEKPENTGIYKVSFNANGGQGTPPQFIRADSGASVTLPQNPFVYKEYKFVGWNVNGNLYNPGESITVYDSVTVKAEWEYVGVQYTLTFSGGEEATGDTIYRYGLKGESVTIPDAGNIIRPGYKLVAWSNNGYEYQFGEEFIVETENVEFTPVWVECWSGAASETAPSQNSEGYYEIGSGEELAWFSNYVNSTDRMANAILTKDIYLNYGGEYTNNWFNFKMGTNEANAFKGTFDGNGHAIIGLYSAGNNYDHGGLFNVLDNATVKNLNIREAKIVGGRDTENQETFIGIIAGYSKASNIENCTVTGTVTEAEGKNIKLCGGIVANLSGGSIRECTADVDINIGSTVTSDEYVNTGVGGIAGRFAYGATAERCGFEGTIEAPNRLHVGGIAGGCNRNDVTVKEVYNRGNITGGSKVAGIIGNSYNCKVYSAYNTGNIAAVAENGIAGGLIGVGTLSNTSGAKGYYTTGTVTGDAAYSGLAFTDASATETKFNSFIYPEFTEGITNAIGQSPDAELGVRMPLNDIASEKALTKLNEWAPDTYKIIPGFNNGYPVFTWQ